MDLEPFGRINPCGMAGLEMTQLGMLGVTGGVHEIALEIAPMLRDALGIDQSETSTTPLSVSSW
jgi:lipoate-protein ligase B